MSAANFYPGPSRIYSNVSEYIYEAYMNGIMSINHRSDQFMELMGETKTILKERLLIPESYEIAFTSSATENWEIITQSLVQKGSYHFYNGAFGEKWFGYADKIGNADKTQFDINDALPEVEIDDSYDVICITQNETSNGTQVSNDHIKKLRFDHPDKIISVDVTSSLGGVKIDFENGDYWYASVQKCLGLPAGLGVVIMSPKAIETAYQINEKNRYNSLVNIINNTKNNQTQYTPNVLGIFLLNRTQRISRGIEHLTQKCLARLKRYDDTIHKLDGFEYLITNEEVRSKTVLALSYSDPTELRNEAEQFGITLGAGYGKWKRNSFRIANFPAIKTKEIGKLTSYLEEKFEK